MATSHECTLVQTQIEFVINMSCFTMTSLQSALPAVRHVHSPLQRPLTIPCFSGFSRVGRLTLRSEGKTSSKSYKVSQCYKRLAHCLDYARRLLYQTADPYTKRLPVDHDAAREQENKTRASGRPTESSAQSFDHRALATRQNQDYKGKLL